MEYVTEKHYDITGSKISRVTKHYLISLFVKHEDFYGGPGLKFLIIAFMTHFFGKIFGYLSIRFEKQMQLIINRIKSG